MAGDRSLQIRMQEIIASSPVEITTIAAAKQALQERYTDPDAMATAAAVMLAQKANGFRKRTYDLPESGDQGSLFDVPAIIGVTTQSDGDLLIPRDLANVGHVRQWTREGRQHHSTQLLRFKRAQKDLETVADVEDGTAWTEARATLAERKRELEAAEAETEAEE